MQTEENKIFCTVKHSNCKTYLLFFVKSGRDSFYDKLTMGGTVLTNDAAAKYSIGYLIIMNINVY